MLKQHSTFIKQLIAFIDVLLITAVFFIAYNIVIPFKSLDTINNYILIPTGFILFYLYFAWTRHLFSILQHDWLKEVEKKTFMVFFSGGILGASILYFLPLEYNSRTLYLIFVSLSFLLVFFEKICIKIFIITLRKHDRNITPILMVGRGKILSELYRDILATPELGLRVVNKLDISTPPEKLADMLKNIHIEEVFFCIPRNTQKEGFFLDPYLKICEEMGRPARVLFNLDSITQVAKWEYHNFLGRHTFFSETLNFSPDQLIFKRILDIIGGTIGFIIFLISFPIVGLAIKLTSKGPILFKQERVGKNGKRFIIYKYRSMVVDAEEQKKLLEKQNELSGPVFKMKEDPRITKVGRFIRKYSIDELPQFINVLKGDMSLVGTRPPTVDEVQAYEKWHLRRISIKPGITGMWQVSGRNKIKDFDEIVRLDLKYIDSWNIFVDIIIILKTILIIFKKDEAY